MGLYISRMIQKTLSWFAGDLLINMEVYFIFLMASILIMFIHIYIAYILINCLDFLFQELGISQGLDWFSFFVPWILPCIFIFILIVFIVLYSLHVESKFLRTDKSWWSGTFVKYIILCIIIFSISIGLSSSNGQLVLRSLPEPLALLVVILYSVLLFLLVVPIMAIAFGIASLIQMRQYNYGIVPHFESARSAVDKLVESQNDEKCLFEWDDIPGKDSEKLASYLREDRDICWVESKNIHKSEDNQSIHTSEDENLIKIMIDEKKEKGILEINNARICDLKVKKENNKLKIYGITNYKDMYRIYMVSENYKSGLNVVKDLLRRGIDLNRNSNLNNALDQLAFWMQYYLFYGGSEQIESVKKHLDHVLKNFDKQYHINSDQFVYEILRMHGTIEGYFEKNNIHPVRSTKFVDRLKEHLLKRSSEVLALIIIALLIHLSGSLPEIVIVKLFQQILQISPFKNLLALWYLP